MLQFGAKRSSTSFQRKRNVINKILQKTVSRDFYSLRLYILFNFYFPHFRRNVYFERRDIYLEKREIISLSEIKW